MARTQRYRQHRKKIKHGRHKKPLGRRGMDATKTRVENKLVHDDK